MIKFATATALVLLLAGCGSTPEPPAPSTPPATAASQTPTPTPSATGMTMREACDSIRDEGLGTVNIASSDVEIALAAVHVGRLVDDAQPEVRDQLVPLRDALRQMRDATTPEEKLDASRAQTDAMSDLAPLCVSADAAGWS